MSFIRKTVVLRIDIWMWRLENSPSPLFLFQKNRLSENDFSSLLSQKIRYRADEKYAAKFPYYTKKNFSEKKFQLIFSPSY